MGSLVWVLPIHWQYGTPLISRNKCQGVYIFMVYVMYITFICCCHSLYIHVLSSSFTAGLFGNYPSSSIPEKPEIWQKSSLRLPNERGQQRKPALTSDFCLVYTLYNHGILGWVSSFIPGISCIWVKHIFWVTVQLSYCPVIQFYVHVFQVLPTSIASMPVYTCQI